MDDNEVDNAYWELVQDLRALYPEEVDSVILLSWGRSEKGTGSKRTYEAKTGRTVGTTYSYAETQYCDVTIVDVRQHKVFPTQRVSNTGSAVVEGNIPTGGAAYPRDMVLKWIEQLPRR